jgi:hypothetical protein
MLHFLMKIRYCDGTLTTNMVHEEREAVECQSPGCTRSVTFSFAGFSRWTLAVLSPVEKKE